MLFLCSFYMSTSIYSIPVSAKMPLELHLILVIFSFNWFTYKVSAYRGILRILRKSLYPNLSWEQPANVRNLILYSLSYMTDCTEYDRLYRIKFLTLQCNAMQCIGSFFPILKPSVYPTQEGHLFSLVPCHMNIVFQ